MKLLVACILSTLLLFSCERMKQGTKEVINKSGETVGKSATEFLEGVSEGVDKTLQCEISVSATLTEQGIKTGKFSIENDTAGGSNNLLVLYVIFDKDFKDNVSAKAFDKNGMETGRAQLLLEGKSGEAKYYDFRFDKRTYIEVKSKIVIE